MATVIREFKKCRHDAGLRERLPQFFAAEGDCDGPLLAARTSHGIGHVSCERHARITHVWAYQYTGQGRNLNDFLLSLGTEARAEFDRRVAECDLKYFYEPYEGHLAVNDHRAHN